MRLFFISLLSYSHGEISHSKMLVMTFSSKKKITLRHNGLNFSYDSACSQNYTNS